MGDPVFYRAGTTEACRLAAEKLKQKGIAFCEDFHEQITDLLLDVPSFSAPGILRSGEDASLLLQKLPDVTRIWGGKLRNFPFEGDSVDLLEDAGYIAQNAAITADCAIRLCSLSLKTTWSDTSALVIGWGRIGKQLCRTLRALGAHVTVCARKPSDRALLSAFGYHVTEPEHLDGTGFQVIFNTAPAEMMQEEELSHCPIPVDLASCPGLKGKNVLWARGLPGIYAPETSGKLIAHTIWQKLGGEKT